MCLQKVCLYQICVSGRSTISTYLPLSFPSVSLPDLQSLSHLYLCPLYSLYLSICVSALSTTPNNLYSFYLCLLLSAQFTNLPLPYPSVSHCQPFYHSALTSSLSLFPLSVSPFNFLALFPYSLTPPLRLRISLFFRSHSIYSLFVSKFRSSRFLLYIRMPFNAFIAL